MKPKYLPKNPSIIPLFDDVIRLLQTPPNIAYQTEQQSNNNNIVSEMKQDIMQQPCNVKKGKKKKEKKSKKQSKQGKNNNNNTINYGGPNDNTIYKDTLNDLTNDYVNDLKNEINDTTKLIINEIKKLNLKSAKLKRATKDYYSQTIEWRQELLNAPNINYLCKSLLMKNTKCINNDCNDPTNSLYYLVLFQYTTKLNSELLMKFVRELHGKLGKRKFNFRLAPADESFKETGFEHNSVTPIGIKNKKIPIIMSDRLLEYGHFWMGGGEVDVKIAINTSEFRNVFKPYVAKIVYDGFIDPNENLED